jgi:FlaA1/EpsC-like NDP-sugar epimerase
MSWYAASRIDYSVVGAVLALIWLSLLALVDSRSRRILGYSAEEYRRIIDATLVLLGVIAFLSVVLELDLAGGHLAIALPLGLIGLLVNRRIWRGVAARKRAKGEYQTSLLVVGSSSAAAEVAAKLVRAGAGLLRGRPLHAGGPDFAGRTGPDRPTRCPGRRCRYGRHRRRESAPVPTQLPCHLPTI